MIVPAEERHPDFPLTLDLRRPLRAEPLRSARARVAMSSITKTHARGPTLPWRFSTDYQPVAGIFDEMLASTGGLRPQCEAFVTSIESIGPQEFAARRDNARRAIRENGVTYNVYGDPQGIDRPWELDMVPLLVPAGRVEPSRSAG